MRYRTVPSTSKAAASAPLRAIVFVPRASSLIAMSATLIRLVVELFSPSVAVTLVRTTAEGG